MATTEERLAALEKQMAAWINQQPTQYYTHQYSGEEIDAAVGRALTGGALDTSVSNVSNQLGTFVRPNLLDNWFFGRPVNQRGHAEYKGDWAYTIDRWQIANGSMEIDNGVTISGDYVFEPLLDIVDSIRGKLVTASILLANNELRYATATIPATWGGWDAIVGGNNGFSLQGVGETSEKLWFVISDKSKVVTAKLELGPTQTLAHQENGVWVLNEVPDYGEQLRRCQRYCQVDDCTTSYTIVAHGIASSATYWRGLLPVHVDMRTKPTISLVGDNISAQLIGNGQSISVSGLSLNVIDSSPAGTAISLSGVAGLTQNQNYDLQLYKCRIIRSADL